MVDNKQLLAVLLHQRENGIDDSVYKMIQCDFAYNSNHMEGSRITPEFHGKVPAACRILCKGDGGNEYRPS